MERERSERKSALDTAYHNLEVACRKVELVLDVEWKDELTPEERRNISDATLLVLRAIDKAKAFLLRSGASMRTATSDYSLRSPQSGAVLLLDADMLIRIGMDLVVQWDDRLEVRQSVVEMRDELMQGIITLLDLDCSLETRALHRRKNKQNYRDSAAAAAWWWEEQRRRRK